MPDNTFERKLGPPGGPWLIRFTWDGSRQGLPLTGRRLGLTTPASVDEYLAAVPERSRAALEGLRETIRAAAPEATETIAYQMPAFREHGRFLVSFAAYKDHCSLFPGGKAVMEAHGEALRPYLSGKGTLRFTADDPIPAALVEKIVKTRIEEIAAPGGR